MNGPEDPREPFDGSMLSSERARPGPPPEVQARMLERLQSALALEPPPRPPRPAPRPWHAAPAARALRYALTLGVGVALGRALPRTNVPAPPRPAITVDAGPPSPTPAPAPTPTFAPDATVPVALPRERPATPARDAAALVRTAPERPVASDLVAETALLDHAHAALARGQAREALAVAADHERRFPHGQLAEDRESVAVQCLVSLGRGAEARARAERFRRRWPRGLQRERVEAALRSLSVTDPRGAPQQP